MDTVDRLVRVVIGGGGEGADVPLNVFRIGAEVGCVVNLVLEELYDAVSDIRLHVK